MDATEAPVELIRIHPKDNIAVVPRSVKAGRKVRHGKAVWTLENDVVLGHKFALKPIAKGEKVHKYGISIGSASEEIPAGGWVHLHNLQSDYIPTYTHESGKQFDK